MDPISKKLENLFSYVKKNYPHVAEKIDFGTESFSACVKIAEWFGLDPPKITDPTAYTAEKLYLEILEKEDDLK